MLGAVTSSRGVGRGSGTAGLGSDTGYGAWKRYPNNGVRHGVFLVLTRSVPLITTPPSMCGATVVLTDNTGGCWRVYATRIRLADLRAVRTTLLGPIPCLAFLTRQTHMLQTLQVALLDLVLLRPPFAAR